MSEISPEVVYWVTRLDHIRMLLGWLSVIAVATSIAAYIYAVVTRSFNDNIEGLCKDISYLAKIVYSKGAAETALEQFKSRVETLDDLKTPIAKSLRIVMFTIIGFFILFAGCAFIPNTKEACAILVIPSIANSEVVQQELPKSVESIVKIANRYLDDLVTEPKKGDQK